MQKYGWTVHLPFIRYACILSLALCNESHVNVCLYKKIVNFYGDTHTHLYILRAVVDIKPEACSSLIVPSQVICFYLPYRPALIECSVVWRRILFITYPHFTQTFQGRILNKRCTERKIRREIYRYSFWVTNQTNVAYCIFAVHSLCSQVSVVCTSINVVSLGWSYWKHCLETS